MTQRSKALFPHADVLAQYLSEFAEDQADAIQYGTSVTLIKRPAEGSGFELSLERQPPAAPGGAAAAEPARCHEVIVATGFWRPRGVKVRVDGAEHVEGYENVPETGEAYEGKSVVVLGLGNAAMETAQELQKYTAELHVLGRQRPLPQGGEGVRFAYQTHYVGDIRAGRTTILDTYLLKSLDTFDFTALEGAKRLLVLPCQGSRRCIWEVELDDCIDHQCRALHRHGGQNLEYRLPIAMWTGGGHAGHKVRKILSRHAPEEEGHGWNISDATLVDSEDREDVEERAEARRKLGIDEEAFSDKFEELQVSSSLLRHHPALLDELVPVRARSTMNNIRYPMDHIIRCFGWAMDTSIFDSSVPVNTTHKGKYPELSPTFEAVGVPGLFFAGTLTHGLDFRKSAGGFIHGFRYTSRALFRLLEARNFGVSWPHALLPLHDTAGVAVLAELLQRRINEASGPYQMFEALGDMVLIERAPAGGNWTARYLEEVPLAHFQREYQHLPRVSWVFKYGEGFHGPAVLGENRVGSSSSYTAELSKFLHPQLSFFPAGESQPSMRHWLFEDIFTQWDADEISAPLARFLTRAVAAATGNTEFAATGAEALGRGPREDGGEARCAAPPESAGASTASVM